MLRVLIVDDQQFVRDSLRSFLPAQEPGWQLSEAANGNEALELFRSTAPDVVVLDIVMEGMNGVVAAWEIRQTETARLLIPTIKRLLQGASQPA